MVRKSQQTPAQLWQINGNGKGNPTMATYAAGPALSALPKRAGGPGRTFDRSAADALLAIVTASPDATATDGERYLSSKAARVASNTARRLLARVAPEGRKPATRLDTAGDVTTWVLYLIDATPVTDEVLASRKAAAEKRAATRAANKAAATAAAETPAQA